MRKVSSLFGAMEILESFEIQLLGSECFVTNKMVN